MTDNFKNISWVHRFLERGKTKICSDWPKCVEFNSNQFRHEVREDKEAKKNSATLFWSLPAANQGGASLICVSITSSMNNTLQRVIETLYRYGVLSEQARNILYFCETLISKNVGTKVS